MSDPRDLAELLAALPPERRAAFDRLSALVAAVPVPESNHSFVFRAGEAEHPVFDDAEAVFWCAVRQMRQGDSLRGRELPLVYWGFHSIDLLGRRHSNGVLVTDRAVVVDDPGGDAVRLPTVDLDPATIRSDGTRLLVADAGIGLEQIARILPAAGAEDAAAYLAAVVAAVRTSDDVAEPRDESVEDVVLASGMSGDLLLPSRPKDAKGLAKLAAKWSLPADEAILVSLSSATFAGVYGLAITDAALYTRDLFEPVRRVPLAEVRALSWDDSEKAVRIGPGHAAPSHPAVTSRNGGAAAALLQDLVRAASRRLP
ncbi:hypothetical protein NB037_15350 [Rathayibacter sp. ZW T2_19]|uniref:Uncharacterized protein n=1 Tax=Rathayibacter rubneri TaxID=2950106 RepID=A0A9X2DZV5_9MICO|nr:hypothetical protein [Rathayibacter rubneri]MCM6763794.1 hypothetical protein [Rathayibacter rubneri]